MKRRWYLRLAAFAPRRWKKLLLIGLLMLGTAGLEALKPWPIKLFVDHVAGSNPFPSLLLWLNDLPGAGSKVGQLAWVSLATFFLFVLGWILQTAQAYLQAGVATRMTYELGSQVFEHLQRLSLRYHGRRPTGDLARRVMHDSRCVRELVLDAMVPALTALLTLGSMVVFMWFLDGTLTLLALLVVPALVIADKVFYKTMMERTLDQQQWEGRLWSQAEETLSAIPLVQAVRRERFEEQRYRAATQSTLKAYFHALFAQVKFNTSVNTSTVLGRTAVIIVGGMHVLDGRLSIGGLLVFLAYLGVLYDPLDTLARLAATIAATEASAQRVFEVLDAGDTLPEPTGVKKEHAMPRAMGHVSWRDVTFAYEPGQPVLRDIDLQIRPGEIVAIVGRTGAGKSTLVSLLLRFFDPCEGSVHLDGVDLRQLHTAALRDQIAILLQEPFLLPVSIAENIAYGRATASREAIVSAAKAAHADEFISRLSQGYDTVIGERGVTLSGGERQRIAIARALLKDAPVLILDEPTSALDTRTESSLMTALERLTEGRTTLIIAHRLSTVRRADRIVIIENGQIIETGTHDELLAFNGAYCRYCQLQSIEANAIAEAPVAI